MRKYRKCQLKVVGERVIAEIQEPGIIFSFTLLHLYTKFDV